MPDKRKKYIMSDLELVEISAVDRPAQEGARALLMKRDNGGEVPDEFSKRVWLTTSTEGHAHLVDEQSFDGTLREGGNTSWTQSEGEERGHSHPWLRDEDDNIIIGEADGHTHQVIETRKRKFTAKEREKLAEEGKALPDGSFPITSKADLRNAIQAFGRTAKKKTVGRHIARRARALGATDVLPEEGVLARYLKVGDKEDTMPDNQQTKPGDELKQVKADLKKLEDDNARLKALAEMNDAQKAHYQKLEDDKAKATFLAKSDEDRQKEVDEAAKQAEDEDPVVYKADDGKVFRKSDDERLVSMAKQADEDRRARKKAEEKVEDQRLRKIAETDLKHLPGDVETRMDLIKSVEGIEDKDRREKAMQSLKAQNEALSKAFETEGHEGAPAEDTPEGQLDKMAEDYAKEHEVSISKAYDAVTQTKKGAALYAKIATN